MGMNPPKERGMALLLIIAILVILAGFLLWEHRSTPAIGKFLGFAQPPTPVSKVTFTCDEGKTITASFYDARQGQQNGSVSLVLSDGRTFTLPRAISGSGIRYANADSSFIFWSKGNTAFVEEGPAQTQTYTGCVTASDVPGEEDWNTFASSTLGISVRYPEDYTVDTRYAYADAGPGAQMHGIKLLVPPALTQGTNLASDTGVSIEELPHLADCSALAFLEPEASRATESSYSDEGVQYDLATTSGAAAGNYYEEQVYAIRGSSPCTAVRYFLHSGNIANYDPGTVEEFDRQALLSQFDRIRESLVLGH